jgi:hypothetical protein
MVLLLCSVANGEGLTAGIFGGVDLDNPSNEVIFRLGYEKDLDIGDIEVGVSSMWHPSVEMPQVWGVYSLFHFENTVQIPQPIPFDWLPATIEARPYVGGHVDIDKTGTLLGPVAGFEIQGILTVEYQYRNYSGLLGGFSDDEHRVIFGTKYRF